MVSAQGVKPAARAIASTVAESSPPLTRTTAFFSGFVMRTKKTNCHVHPVSRDAHAERVAANRELARSTRRLARTRGPFNAQNPGFYGEAGVPEYAASRPKSAPHGKARTEL